MADLFGMLQAAAGASAGGDYQISRSLRFNSADDSLLTRTIGTTGNRRKFTFSCWTKISYIGSDIKALMTSTDNASSTSWIFLNTTGGRGAASALSFEIQTPSLTTITTSAVFRDPSAWYHIVVAVDTDQATDTNRVKFYSNGVQLTNTTGTFPAINRDSVFNTSGFRHGIGGYWDGTTAPYDGYMAEVYWIDGQQLTPSDFGETDETTGVWKPKEYTGTYGTNGFYLNFSDNSDVTATTLGKDDSGNGNNYTPSGSPGFSVTAGAGNDSLVDSPTRYGTDTGAGGEVRGNYCTLSPVYALNVTYNTPANGNLEVALSNNSTSYGTFSFTTGKWYWEITVSAAVTSGYVGVMDSTFIKTDNSWGSQARTYIDSGSKYGGSSSSYGASWTNGDVIGVAVDMDAGTIVFYKNGSSQGTAFSDLAGKEWKPMVYATTTTYTLNFGQRPFAHTAPSGFKALCTTNLPDPTVVQGDDYFNTVLYTGNGTTAHAITGFGFQPDWIWQKSRNQVNNHHLTDAVRGVNKDLLTNSTTAEVTYTDGVTSFNSDGFTVGNQSSEMNASGITYAVWGWKANGAGVSNTDGTITSTVSANTTAGISIVTWTTPNDATSAFSVGHGLGVAPKMIITKARTGAFDWWTWHISLGDNTTDYVALNLTNQELGAAGMWGTVGRNSTVFGMKNGVSTGTNVPMVAYCFAEVEGFSKFGSYTGNGDATDGAFVYTGFRPAFVMVKRTNDTGAWRMFDIARSPTNVIARYLYANYNFGEDTGAVLDFVSNGFKYRNNSTDNNASGSTYIYMAFAENPFKYALAR